MHWIKAEIHEFVLRNWRIVKVATTKAQRKLFFNLRQMKNHLGWFTNQEVDEVAEDLGVSREDVLLMQQRMMALDSPYGTLESDDEDDSYKNPERYLFNPSDDPAHILEKEDSGDQGREKLMVALEQLDERSQDIYSSVGWLKTS